MMSEYRTHDVSIASSPKEKKIVRNAARCRKCGDVIESKSVHDFQMCSCEAIFVDGGRSYLRHGGNPEDFESLCEWADAD